MALTRVTFGCGSSVEGLRADANPYLTGLKTLLSGAGITLTEDVPTNSITIAAAGGAGNKITLSHDQQEAAIRDGAAEILLVEWNADIDDLAAGNIQARLSALVKRAGLGTVTYNLRTGGTIGAADGSVRATFTTASGTYVQAQNIGVAFANPTGELLVKVTAVPVPSNGGPGADAYIRGIYVSLG